VIGSLPATPGVYVTGKLLSVWLPLVALLALSVTVIGTVVWLRQGAFDIGTFAVYGIASVLPSALFMSGVSVLWPARQPTRRRATLFGFLLVCVSVVVFAVLMLDYFVAAMNMLANSVEIDARAAFPTVTSPDYVVRLLAMLGVLAASWLFVRARVQE
jgi:ABC-type Na+ efflux pump permease subunit